MRKDLGKKMYFLPLSVVVIGSYDKNNVPNAMTAAWSTIYDFGQVFISIALEHKSAKNIALNKCFTLAFADQKNIAKVDYVGLVSGNKQKDKVSKAGFDVIKSKKINAPIFANFPLTLECKMVSMEGGNLVGEVVNVNVDKKCLTKDNKIDIEKMNLVCYDMTSSSYRLIGKKIATAFKVGKAIK